MSQGENMEEEKKEFKYTIGEKVYYQRKLVLGQVNQLIDLTKGLEFPEEINILDIMRILGDKLVKAIGIVLIPAEIPLKNKVLDNVISDISFELSTEQAMVIIEDFFDCNQISLLLKRIEEMIGKIGEKVGRKEEVEKMKQGNSVPCSQVETPQNVTT